MISKWYGLKEKALSLRRKGNSIRNVEIELGIPRSTLSGWFKDIKLNKIQRKILDKNHRDALFTARKKAVVWHNREKEKRLCLAQGEATKVIEQINIKDANTIELALAMLYLGEGFKKKSVTGIGNSDPLVLIFFITLMRRLYAINTRDFSCNLHLRADQDPSELKLYWSKTLNIPLENFRKTSIDKRTAGSPTYESYKGVCVIRCGNVALQRKLVYLSRTYCERTIASMGG